MTFTSSLLVWLAPAGALLAYLWISWVQTWGAEGEEEKCTFLEWLDAHRYISALIITQFLLWVIPLGLVVILFGFLLVQPLTSIFNEYKWLTWKYIWQRRLVAVSMLILLQLLLALMPPSAPNGAVGWGEPLMTESDSAPMFPASEQYTWVLLDGTIIVETHMQSVGTLNPWFLSGSVNWISTVSGAKEARFQDSVSLMDEWVGEDAFSLKPVHNGVRHDYDGKNLMYTHDEIMLDLMGQYSYGEMVTVWQPMWGGEIHLLTVIKPGPDPFVGNPGAESYAVQWLDN